MKFYCILKNSQSNPTIVNLLKQSCLKRGIEFSPIYFENFDFTSPLKIKEEVLLYRASIEPESSFLEKYLVNKKCLTFHQRFSYIFFRPASLLETSIVHQKNKLPIIKTILYPSKDPKTLKKYVKFLNGFPIIVKVGGGSHGRGVIKVDSFESLTSIIDFLHSQGQLFILRQFIQHKRQARLIVLGNQVIASHENLVTDDFRTNAGENEKRKRRIKSYDKKIQAIAVKAVNSLKFETGGVDILFDEKNRPHLAEVNFPCYFPTTQNLTGIDISGMMIDFLLKKSKK